MPRTAGTAEKPTGDDGYASFLMLRNRGTPSAGATVPRPPNCRHRCLTAQKIYQESVGWQSPAATPEEHMQPTLAGLAANLPAQAPPISALRAASAASGSAAAVIGRPTTR